MAKNQWFLYEESQPESDGLFLCLQPNRKFKDHFTQEIEVQPEYFICYFSVDHGWQRFDCDCNNTDFVYWQQITPPTQFRKGESDANAKSK